MTSWQVIFGREPPIRGEEGQFAQARDRFGAMREDADFISTAFQSVTESGSAGNLEGESGSAFDRVVDEVNTGVFDLPRVSGEAEDIFSGHYTRLAELRDAADQALERAIAAWDRRNDLEADAAALRQQVAAAASRADSLQDEADANPDADNGADIDAANSQRSQAAGALGNTEQAIADETSTLDGIESEWSELRDAEDSRDSETMDALDSIDLGDLQDPGFMGSIAEFVSSVLEAMADFALDLTLLDEIFNAIVNGDWAALLWELKQMLDVALLVLGTIALFTGIWAPLGVALIALGVASLAVNTTLYLTQMPNPETGETVGLTDVVISAVAVAFSGASLARTARVAQLSRVTPSATSRTFAQQFAYQNRAGFGQGSIASLIRNVPAGGRNLVGTARNVGQLRGQGRSLVGSLRGARGMPLPSRPGTPVVSPSGDLSVQQSGLTTLWGARGVAGRLQNFTPIDFGDDGRITGSTGYRGAVDTLGDGARRDLGTAQPTANYFRNVAQRSRFPSIGQRLAPGSESVLVIPAAP